MASNEFLVRENSLETRKEIVVEIYTVEGIYPVICQHYCKYAVFHIPTQEELTPK